jgi:hypothetical protein
MRSRLVCAGFSCALSLVAPRASAEPSPKDAPRTTDELFQLYVAEVGYAGLTGLMVHDLAGQDSLPSFALPSVGVAALALGATAQADSEGGLSLGQPQAIATDTGSARPSAAPGSGTSTPSLPKAKVGRVARRRASSGRVPPPAR